MSSEEFQELQEHAEHAKHNPSLAPISLTMAVLAVVVATVSLLGHRAHTEEVVLQGRVSDAWSFFQAKNIRRHLDQIYLDTTPAAKDEQSAKIHEKYAAEATRYEDEQKELEAEARKLETERDRERSRATYYDLGEVFLEIGLVITSITLLSGRRAFWFAGLTAGAIGVAIVLYGFLAPTA